MSSIAPSKAIIDLGAYAHNIRLIRHLIPGDCGIMPAVKTNAYGHGAVPIARQAVAEGVAMLAVSNVAEAVELREGGIDAPILVLMSPPEGALGAVIEHGLRLTISDVRTAERVGELARRANKVVPVHCKVDTGMGRQGFDMDSAVSDLLHLTRISHIDIEGICTHFPVADLPRDPFTNNQIKAFKQVLNQLDKEGIPYEMAHAANSAGMLYHPSGAFDMVRPGLITYGAWPAEPPPSPAPFRPVLRWESEVALVKDLPPRRSVGYGRTYITQSPTRVAVIPVGYADGYKFTLANRADVLIRGKRCPVRGRISMDQIVVDITRAEGVVCGDTVTLIGTDGDSAITVEELARHAGTVAQDIFTGIGWRVERVYVE
jgi:alanine racemase